MTITDWLLIAIAIELALVLERLRAIGVNAWLMKEFLRTGDWPHS